MRAACENPGTSASAMALLQGRPKVAPSVPDQDQLPKPPTLFVGPGQAGKYGVYHRVV